MTEQQQRKVCAELALRTGSYFWFADSSSESDGNRWLSTRELMARSIKQYPTLHETCLELPIDWKISDIPSYFTNAADNRALVQFIAADSARWKEFDDRLLMALSLQPLPAFDGTNVTFLRMVRQMIMTAPLETITLAAAKALGIEVGE